MDFWPIFQTYTVPYSSNPEPLRYGTRTIEHCRSIRDRGRGRKNTPSSNRVVLRCIVLRCIVLHRIPHDGLAVRLVHGRIGTSTGASIGSDRIGCVLVGWLDGCFAKSRDWTRLKWTRHDVVWHDTTQVNTAWHDP